MGLSIRWPGPFSEDIDLVLDWRVLSDEDPLAEGGTHFLGESDDVGFLKMLSSLALTWLHLDRLWQSFKRGQPIKFTGPGEDILVCGDQPMAFKRGGDNEPVGGVRMEIGEAGRAQACFPIHRNFDHSLFQLYPAPLFKIFLETDSALALQHCDFPKRNRGDGKFAGLPRPINFAPGKWPQTFVTGSKPQNDVCIEQDQSSASLA